MTISSDTPQPSLNPDWDKPKTYPVPIDIIKKELPTQATCKTCGGIVPNHTPSNFDQDGIGHPDHKIQSPGFNTPMDIAPGEYQPHEPSSSSSAENDQPSDEELRLEDILQLSKHIGPGDTYIVNVETLRSWLREDRKRLLDKVITQLRNKKGIINE